MITIPILIIVAAAVGLLNTQPASPLLHLWVKPAWQECTKQNNTGGESQFKHSSWSSFSWCPILATNSANLSAYHKVQISFAECLQILLSQYLRVPAHVSAQPPLPRQVRPGTRFNLVITIITIISNINLEISFKNGQLARVHSNWPLVGITLKIYLPL